jgi:hypothetical protein
LARIDGVKGTIKERTISVRNEIVENISVQEKNEREERISI